ncbi:hypothetical protein FBY34_8583 [Streptomyces sp. SLBN-115]|nr:hypothetical protein FBY34_8583 [Streptomyces sp. SLBN-115]
MYGGVVAAVESAVGHLCAQVVHKVPQVSEQPDDEAQPNVWAI